MLLRGFDVNIFAGVYLFFPETANRHLEEVDQIFRDSSNIFDPPKMAKRLPQRSLQEVVDEEKREVVEKENVGNNGLTT